MRLRSPGELAMENTRDSGPQTGGIVGIDGQVQELPWAERRHRHGWHVATRFGVPGLRFFALRLAFNLPAEIAARCLRRVAPRFGRT